MSEAISRHQLFEYEPRRPFQFLVERSTAGTLYHNDLYLNHWHEELEIVYYVHGKAIHRINNEFILAETGHLVVTNCGMVHSITPDPAGDGLSADNEVIILIIKPQFILENLPEFEQYYITNTGVPASKDIQDVMHRIHQFMEAEPDQPFDHLYARSLLLELLYDLCRERIVQKDAVDDINILRNIERLKGIIQYIETHYQEHICQDQVARRFYFNPAYFCRYFKKYTGMTFTEYLTLYRLGHARQELLETPNSVLDIAMHCGFSDSRRLILAFERNYGTTPLQYRKQHTQGDEVKIR